MDLNQKWKFHEGWTKNVNVRVNKQTKKIFKHSFDIIRTCFEKKNHEDWTKIFKHGKAFLRSNVLTKLYKDWKINVASTVFNTNGNPLVAEVREGRARRPSI
ncbi:hypothetical protein DPMN_176856 [Dreissena polymorpha]|uniref:Uncharacterized protein n=1 Tax=Dreissena polymorpha TaxID=45954 RepID=A0A9D4EAN4_DREPO|nr:hypothetical protein DPMN_176856 [Dreissena polymorpha]